MDRTYCTINEVMDDLGLQGVPKESTLLRRIQEASQYIEREIGQFIPITDTLSFPSSEGGETDADDEAILMVPPITSITSVTVWGTLRAAGDYRGWPYARHWPNGPYSGLQAVRYNGGTLGAWACLPAQNVIAGHWGMYEATEALGVNITSASASDTTLTVLDGSMACGGMVMLVESEQILVLERGAASNSTATLSADCTDTAEELTLSNGSLVKAGEIVRVGFEQMQVIEVQTNQVLVSRGYAGSRRASHTSGTAVYVYRTFSVRRGVNGTTAATHSSAAAYVYRPPEDVNYLCRQIAALMIKKAQTGYVGRGGNDDLGTGFWVNEFPRNQIDAVKQNYSRTGL